MLFTGQSNGGRSISGVRDSTCARTPTSKVPTACWLSVNFLFCGFKAHGEKSWKCLNINKMPAQVFTPPATKKMGTSGHLCLTPQAGEN